jgi:hypothetical protein
MLILFVPAVATSIAISVVLASTATTIICPYDAPKYGNHNSTRHRLLSAEANAAH